MDLMIEAKDKEQAVFALRRKWNIEGGLPAEWILTGERMDEEREIPSEMGVKVFYEEGEEWRFKPPIKMPTRIAKMLDKLDKAKVKVEGDELEIAKLEEEKRNVLAEWETEKRIKWGLEKKADINGENGVNGVTSVSTSKTIPKTSSSRKSRKIEIEEAEEEAEYSPVTEIKVRTTSSRRRRKTVGDEEVETQMTEVNEELTNGNRPTRTRSTRSRKSSIAV